MKIRMITGFLGMLLGWLTGLAQANPPAPQLPVIPLNVSYHYVPQYFIQWLDKSSEFSLIEGLVNSQASPASYEIILIDKAGHQTHYTNREDIADALKKSGEDVYRTGIAFKEPAPGDAVKTYEFALKDKKGQPILWRFVTASPVTPRAAGLTASPQSPGLLLLYRNVGTAAGAGTAVQIGDKVNEAEPWNEISSPPYFMAYRGSYTEGMHIARFDLGKRQWHVQKQPAAIQVNAEWIVANSQGGTLSLKIASLEGDQIKLQAVREGNTVMELTGRLHENTVDLSEISLFDQSHDFRIGFNPSLPNLCSSAPASPVAFYVDENKKHNVVQGEVQCKRTGDSAQFDWAFKNPAWVKSKTLRTAVSSLPDGFEVSTN
jgi:hypothetical protein